MVFEQLRLHSEQKCTVMSREGGDRVEAGGAFVDWNGYRYEECAQRIEMAR